MRCTLGKIMTQGAVRTAQDLRPREQLTLLIFSLLVLLFGLFPDLLLELTRSSVAAIPEYFDSCQERMCSKIFLA